MNAITEFLGTDGATRANFNSRISEMNTACVQTYTYTKSSGVYALSGSGPNGKFYANDDYAEGDTFTVNGTAVTAQLQNGDSLPDEFFKAGATVPFIYDAENAKLNFKQSGGTKLNLFVQPDEPENKNGIWIEAPEKHSVNRITDKNSFTIGGEIRTYDSSLNAGTAFNTVSNLDRTVALSYNGDIYQIRGHLLGATLYLYIYRWNHSTNTVSTVYSHTITLSSSGSAPGISAVIACISGTTLYAAVSCVYDDTVGTIICNFDLTTQIGTTTTDAAHDLLTGQTGNVSYMFPSGQVGAKGTIVYFVYRANFPNTPSYYTALLSFDFATNTHHTIKTISSNTTSQDNEKSLSEGVLVDDKIYYQCFTDSSDTSQTTIRIFDTTTNTETTQSLGGSLHPLPSIYGITAYQNKLYLRCTDSTASLHEFEIGVWTNRTISPFATAIVAVIQIGTSLAVLYSSGNIQYYDFASETLAENTLAILDGISRNTQLISTSKMNVPFRFQDAWWYSTDFNEYPTYIGDGSAWTKYKN
ncbi:hypothetical protein EQM14_01705 [Caproiciproducens sp. NJN-50]|uniref:hypothetical protein n=1 Tax=Caproiciproducens sp. NJN-50 TaxID=2507162 RepID=UPI000FFE22B0|nr:hypothetical protein [Caproiciproducens sp. NJN-50]QAT48599.1 hypothetical protein EQM14_01705 [Caproiciproducens sp. NJN-50]